MLEPMPWPCCAKAGVPRNKATATAKNEMLIMRFIGTSQLILNPQPGGLTHSDNMVRRSKVHVLPSVPHTEERRPGLGRLDDTITLVTSSREHPFLEVQTHTKLNERVHTFPDSIDFGPISIDCLKTHPEMVESVAN